MSEEAKVMVPEYAITIAKLNPEDGKVIFQASAGANSLDQFTKTDLVKFVKHFKAQMDEIDAGKVAHD